jgi:hypothetical protein
MKISKTLRNIPHLLPYLAISLPSGSSRLIARIAVGAANMLLARCCDKTRQNAPACRAGRQLTRKLFREIRQWNSINLCKCDRVTKNDPVVRTP